MAALSNQIFVGRLCKDGKTWKEGKQDVTSDVLLSIIQYVEPGHEITVNAGGVPKYIIRVTEISSENANVDLPDTAAQDSASKSNSPAVSG